MRSGRWARAAVELAVDILPFGQDGHGREQVEVGAQDLAVEIGRADLERAHPAFAGEEARSGTSSWLSGKRKSERSLSVAAWAATALRARARGAAVTASKCASATPNSAATARSQSVVPSSPKGKGAGMWRAPRRASASAVSARKGW